MIFGLQLVFRSQVESNRSVCGCVAFVSQFPLNKEAAAGF